MRYTSLRSAIFPITLKPSLAIAGFEQADSGSRNSPGPKSSNDSDALLSRLNLLAARCRSHADFFEPGAHLFSSRIGNGAEFCSTVVGAAHISTMWQVRPEGKPHLARDGSQPFHRSL